MICGERDGAQAVEYGTWCREPSPWSFMLRGRRHYTGCALGVAAPGVVVVVWQLAQERPTRREADCSNRRQTLQAKAGAASASPGATAGRGHASLQTRRHCKDARCCDARMLGMRVPQPFTGAWDRGLGCRETANPGHSCCVSDTISHSRQGKSPATTGHCRQ